MRTALRGSREGGPEPGLRVQTGADPVAGGPAPPPPEASGGSAPRFWGARTRGALAWLAGGGVLAVLFYLDGTAMDWVQGIRSAADGAPPLRRDDLTRAVLEVYGTGYFTVLVAAAVYRFDRRRGAALLLVLVVAVASVSSYAIKNGTGRMRPTMAAASSGTYVTRFEGPLAGLASSRYQSFPSGHTTAAMAHTIVLASLYPALTPVVVGLAAVVGLERVYLAKHFPSDVFAAMLLSLAVGRAVRSWMRRRRLLDLEGSEGVDAADG